MGEMSNFEAYPGKLKVQSTNISDIKKQINILKNQLDRCNGNLRHCLSPKSSPKIRSSITAMSNSLQEQISHLSSLSSGLVNISNNYINTEKAIQNNKLSITATLKDFIQNIIKLIEGEKINGDIWSIGKTNSGNLWGVIPVTGSISGSLIGYEISGSHNWGSIEYDENGKIKNVGIDVGLSGSGYLAKGTATSTIAGIITGTITGSVGNISGSGKIGASLFKDGKFEPALVAELKGKVNVAEGSYESKIGNEYIDKHIKVQGEVLGASAETSGQVGKVDYVDNAGNTVTGYGVHGKVGAEAYVAQGSVTEGWNILGIKIDATVSGKAGGGGVSVGGHATTSGVGIDGSIGAGLGLGLKINIDWSGAADNIMKFFGGKKASSGYSGGGGAW